jgi:hypothetical protein
MIDVPGCIEGPLSIPERVRGWKDAAASDALAWPDATGCQYVIGAQSAISRPAGSNGMATEVRV